MIRLTALVCLLALSSFNCATPSSQTGAMAADPMKMAVSSLASKVGVNETYVTLAMTAAQGLLGQGKDAGTAAKEGVGQAASKATADGKAFTGDQTAGLIEGLTGLLGKKM